jgi:hypothetical protein
MRNKCGIMAVGLMMLAGVAGAGPVFFDNFNSENGGNWKLNYTQFQNWTVASGAVDLIGEGSPWNFFPSDGYSLYVDMDGSIGQAGKMVTSKIISLQPGSYVLSYELAGNQRGDTDDSVIVTVDLGILSASHALASDAPFTLFTNAFTISQAQDIQISFAGTGGDNVGMLLDNVSVCAVPAPGALLLGSMGMGLVGWLRRGRSL